MIDIRQSIDFGNFLKTLNWKVVRINKTNYFIKKIPLIGNFIKIQRPKKIDFDVIDDLIKNYKPYKIIIEPIDNRQINDLLLNGYKLSKSPYLPTKSVQINLNKNINEIFNSFKKKSRYDIKKSENVEVVNENNLEMFRKIFIKNVNIIKRYIPSENVLTNMKKIFKENLFLLKDKNNTSGGVFLIANSICYYWLGFTGKTGRKQLSQYKIIWTAIKQAKQKGCKIFDFEGIYDERFPQKSWIGFSKFKESFGGKIIEYPGCFSKTYWRSLVFFAK